MTCTQESFLKDVKDHVMEVLMDSPPTFRHIRFRKPGTMCMHFDLITWPGYLCFTGDMGTYVFRRLEDMFEFFRTKEGHSPDRRYWAEKIQSPDGSKIASEWSPERFKQVINDYRLRWVRDNRDTLTKAQRRELWEEVESQVLYSMDEGEHAVYMRANEFCHRVGDERFCFNDLWDHRFTDYTYHFTWCCYALAWGIRQYDNKPTIQWLDQSIGGMAGTPGY